MTSNNDDNIDIATLMLESDTTTTVDWSDHTVDSSIFDSSYTYSNDKYSCVKEFYHIHLAFNYIIFLSGLVCLVSRLIPASNKYNIHAWSGRIYILAMLWSTSTSLLINNEGLPVAVLVSFVAVMGGLTFGWIAIIVHKQIINNQATKIVQKQLIETIKRGSSGGSDGSSGGGSGDSDSDSDSDNKETDATDIDLDKMMNEAKMDIVKSKTFVQRFFSLKSMHGILFFVSWMQIAGRIFNSGDGEFSCRSYPIYKPIEAPHIPDEAFVEGSDQNRLKLINVHDPNWEAMPWSDGPVQWALLIIMASAFMASIGGVLFSLFFTWLASSRTRNSKEETSPEVTKPIQEEQEEQEEDEEVELTIGDNDNINYDSTNTSGTSENNARDDNIVESSSSSSLASS